MWFIPQPTYHIRVSSELDDKVSSFKEFPNILFESESSNTSMIYDPK